MQGLVDLGVLSTRKAKNGSIVEYANVVPSSLVYYAIFAKKAF